MSNSVSWKITTLRRTDRYRQLGYRTLIKKYLVGVYGKTIQLATRDPQWRGEGYGGGGARVTYARSSRMEDTNKIFNERRNWYCQELLIKISPPPPIGTLAVNLADPVNKEEGARRGSYALRENALSGRLSPSELSAAAEGGLSVHLRSAGTLVNGFRWMVASDYF